MDDSSKPPRTLSLLVPPEEFIADLRKTGKAMRPLNELLGEGDQLYAFFDYKEDGPYATSPLHLMRPRHWDELVARLEQVRAAHSVQSRALQYKKLKTWREVTIPDCFAKFEKAGALAN